MGFTSEIYLTKKHVTKENWLNLINKISDYNGLLNKWKIIIINNKNQIRYFVETKCSLPITINNLDCFLLKKSKRIKKITKKNILLSINKTSFDEFFDNKLSRKFL